MRFRSLALAIIVSIIYSCGSKKSAVSKEELIKEANIYTSEVDGNSNLKKTVTEGALTDAEGVTDIGTFKYTVFFDENTESLYKIENIETTTETIHETYYFKDGKFVFVKFKSAKNGDSLISKGSLKDGKTESLKFYAHKAKRFQKAFEKRH